MLRSTELLLDLSLLLCDVSKSYQKYHWNIKQWI